MIDNPDKFEAIIMNKKRENQITHKLKIYSNEIETTKSIKLLGIENDKLRSEATIEPNSICRLARFMGNKEKIAMINSFVDSNFYYCLLVWHFCSCDSSQKIEKN